MLGFQIAKETLGSLLFYKTEDNSYKPLVVALLIIILKYTLHKIDYLNYVKGK